MRALTAMEMAQRPFACRYEIGSLPHCGHGRLKTANATTATPEI